MNADTETLESSEIPDISSIHSLNDDDIEDIDWDDVVDNISKKTTEKKEPGPVFLMIEKLDEKLFRLKVSDVVRKETKKRGRVIIPKISSEWKVSKKQNTKTQS